MNINGTVMKRLSTICGLLKASSPELGIFLKKQWNQKSLSSYFLFCLVEVALTA
jgi:hypothetical protein